MKLTGRILTLFDDPELVRDQLAGADLAPDGAPLAYGVNTDAIISGRACTFGYAPEVLGPHFLENYVDVVAYDAVRRAGFQVVVAGDAYGSGSSREVAVVAHRGAGIELVVARSLQRIFQENLVYAGLPFTSDFGVVERLQAGEDVPREELNATLPTFFAQVAASGGLLPYGEAWLRGDLAPWYPTERRGRPSTVIEKIVARHAWAGGSPVRPRSLRFGLADVRPGEQVLARVGFRGLHEYTTGMVMDLYRRAFGDAPIVAPERAAAFEDHFVLLEDPDVPETVRAARLGPARRLAEEMIEACRDHGIPLHGAGHGLSAGVCHRVVVEEYAEPGEIVVLTDSHSPTAGVLDTFAFGVGSTAMAFALRTGVVPVTVPKTVRVVVRGDPGSVLSSKDLALHLIGDPYFRDEQWRSSPTDTCAIQFGGPGLDAWSVDELSVLTNMTVEGGLMTGVVEPCAAITDFLAERRGRDLAGALVAPDPDAAYEQVIEVDLDRVPITVATPGDSRNRKPLGELGQVPVQNVVIASCTGGSLADLRAAAAVLRGRELHRGVTLTITPSSEAVARAAADEGLVALFESVGARVTAPGCGACIGNGPGIPRDGDTTASTTNRNFARRMGAPGPVYLVSPAVAAATAVTGVLSDPREI